MNENFEIRIPDGLSKEMKFSRQECEWRLTTFVQRDAFLEYDYRGCYANPPTDTITALHRCAMNRAMTARSSIVAWDNFVGQPLPELSSIPLDLDLIDSSDATVREAWNALRPLVRRITSVSGIKDVAASKVLYLLRPRFVAIVDTHVRAAFGIGADDPDEIVMAVQRGIRWIGRQNGAALDFLFDFVRQIPCDAPQSRLSGQNIPIHLSKSRILDILIWSSRAPHKEWARWYLARHSRNQWGLKQNWR